MIQTIHRSTGGTVRHVCSFGRPAGGLFSWRLYSEAGALIDSADNVAGGMPDTTAANSSSKRGDQTFATVGSLAGDWRSLMIQPASLGTVESLRSFSMPFQVGAANTDAVLFDPLPIDIATGDRVVINEVKVALAPVLTAAQDAGIYFFEVIADDEAGDEHREATRLAITSANIVQPASYSSLTRRYPLLIDQARPEDPLFSVALDTALELTIEQMERWGFGWYNLRTWDQLEASICAHCAATEFGAMGPAFDDAAIDARDAASALLRDTIDKLAWVDQSGDGTPVGDRRPDVSRVWISR